ncbi:TRAP transporter substrate-binding protein [Marasmitruncus massiliensis]|uniref:TRAP transporter substrate-binding protein n=1 Tax=Marasmitruncus massiliensis TaxID=1944642 RepID=UPI000C7B2014|nr:TRAP transporter substrate-binding protein [Marasmitruncus massiliensis]
MNLKKSLAIVLATMLTLSLTACNSSTASSSSASESALAPAEPSTPAETITLRLASNHTEDFVTSKACIKFAELVAEKTNGAVVVENYFNAVLGEEKATIEQAQFGGIDLIRVNMSPLAEFVDELNALQFPYIFASREHFWDVMDSDDIGKAILHSDAMVSNNLYGLCYYDNGTRNFFFSDADVHTPSDMANLSIRVQESNLMIGMVRAMGANPTAMTSSEIYSALQTGVIDGAENNLPWYLSMSLNEVAPKITMDEHNRSADLLVMSKASMDKLTEDQITAIQEAADESSQYQRELWVESEKEARKTCLEVGCTIVDLEDSERQLFMDSVKEMNATEGAKYSDLFAKIAALQ